MPHDDALRLDKQYWSYYTKNEDNEKILWTRTAAKTSLTSDKRTGYTVCLNRKKKKTCVLLQENKA